MNGRSRLNENPVPFHGEHGRPFADHEQTRIGFIRLTTNDTDPARTPKRAQNLRLCIIG